MKEGVKFDSLSQSHSFCTKQASQQGLLFILKSHINLRAQLLVLDGGEFMEQRIKIAKLTTGVLKATKESTSLRFRLLIWETTHALKMYIC